MANKKFRCPDEDGFLFTGKMEYVRHRVAVPGGGYQFTEWKQGQSKAFCPYSPNVVEEAF